jgi:hypothetical protein
MRQWRRRAGGRGAASYCHGRARRRELAERQAELLVEKERSEKALETAQRDFEEKLRRLGQTMPALEFQVTIPIVTFVNDEEDPHHRYKVALRLRAAACGAGLAWARSSPSARPLSLPARALCALREAGLHPVGRRALGGQSAVLGNACLPPGA